jgi:glutathione S-transferase
LAAGETTGNIGVREARPKGASKRYIQKRPPMKLHFHPVSSYSQKTVFALREQGFKYEPVIVDIMSPEGRAAYKKLYPVGKLPLLVGDGLFIPESTIIIEYADTHDAPKGRLIPDDKDEARKARFFDRVFDQHVNDPMSTIFFDGRKPAEAREPGRVAAAKERLDVSYAFLDQHFAKNTWSVGDKFTMADCAAAPALAYARMVYPYEAHKNLGAYFSRLAERPAFQQVLAEAAPYLAKMSGK